MGYRLVWFTTARGPGSRRLLAAVQEKIRAGELPASIACVFCSREPGESAETDLFFRQVQGYGLPLVCLSWRRFRQRLPSALRQDFDAQVMELLEPHPMDLGVLAGYMLIVSPPMCRRYPLLNLHPALPGGPAGTWQEVLWQLIEGQAEESGVMLHVVTPDLDQGPVVTYCRYPLKGPDLDPLWQEVEAVPPAELRSRYGESLPLFQALRERGLSRELPLLIATLQAFARGKVHLQDGLPVLASGERIPGLDLTSQVEASLSG